MITGKFTLKRLALRLSDSHHGSCHRPRQTTSTSIPPSENKPSKQPPNGFVQPPFNQKKTAQPSINAYPLHFLSDDLGICSRNSVVTDIRSSSISVCKHLAGTFLSSESQGFSAVSGKFVFFFQAEIQENSETEKKHGLLWFLQNQPWPETKGRTTQGSWSSSSWHLPIKDLLDEDHVPGAKSPTLVQPAANRKDDQAKTLRQEDWQPW